MEKLLWLDGTISRKSEEEVLDIQKYDPDLGYYFELDGHLFFFHNNMWMEGEK